MYSEFTRNRPNSSSTLEPAVRPFEKVIPVRTPTQEHGSPILQMRRHASTRSFRTQTSGSSRSFRTPCATQYPRTHYRLRADGARIAAVNRVRLQESAHVGKKISPGKRLSHCDTGRKNTQKIRIGPHEFSGNENDRQVAVRLAGAKKQVATGESRHFVIGDQEIRALLGQRGPSCFTIPGEVDVVTVGAQDLPENVANSLIVVDDENARCRRPEHLQRTVAGLRGGKSFPNGIAIIHSGHRLSAKTKRIFGYIEILHRKDSIINGVLPH